MFKPAERIVHRADPGHWPDADTASASRLFAPVQVGTMQLATRTWVPAMVPWRATPDGEAGLNYLCPGMKRFYTHIRRDLPEILRRVRKERGHS